MAQHFNLSQVKSYLYLSQPLLAILRSYQSLFFPHLIFTYRSDISSLSGTQCTQGFINKEAKSLIAEARYTATSCPSKYSSLPEQVLPSRSTTILYFLNSLISSLYSFPKNSRIYAHSFSSHPLKRLNLPSQSGISLHFVMNLHLRNSWQCFRDYHPQSLPVGDPLHMALKRFSCQEGSYPFRLSSVSTWLMAGKGMSKKHSGRGTAEKRGLFLTDYLPCDQQLESKNELPYGCFHLGSHAHFLQSQYCLHCPFYTRGQSPQFSAKIMSGSSFAISSRNFLQNDTIEVWFIHFPSLISITAVYA